MNLVMSHSRSPFHEGPENFSQLKSRSKISNLLTTELFYSIFLIRTEGLFTQKVSMVYSSLPVFKNRLTKSGFTGTKRYWSFREMGRQGRMMKKLEFAVYGLGTKKEQN